MTNVQIVRVMKLCLFFSYSDFSDRGGYDQLACGLTGADSVPTSFLNAAPLALPFRVGLPGSEADSLISEGLWFLGLLPFPLL